MIRFVSKKQIDNTIKECQALEKLAVLFVVQKEGKFFTVLCDYITTHCSNFTRAYITKEYTSFVFNNGSVLDIVTDKYEGKGKKYNSVVVENGIDSERIKSIFASLELPSNFHKQRMKIKAREDITNEYCTSKTSTR